MKKNKKILVASLMLLAATSGFAQSAQNKSSCSGIYLSYADYKAGKLSYTANCSTENQGILRHDQPAKTTVEVKCDGVKHKLKKKDIYALRDCDNHVFRFFHNNDYQLAESGPIFIYFRDEGQSEGKNGFKMEKVYYFSATPDGDLLPLTVDALKTAFPANVKFHDLLDSYFKDKLPDEYDKFTNMYKVNHLYELSEK